MRNQKSVIFVMTLMVLLIGLTAISAADTGNNTASSVISDNTISADTTSVGSIASTVSDTKTVKSEAKTITKTNSEKLVSDTTKKTIKSNMKNTKKTNSEITVNNDNFDTYFTSNGFTDEVQTGSKINFGTNITRNNHSYVLNKQVTIDGKGNTLSLNTISGSYYGNETGSAFIIDHGASGTQLSNLNFYNTQVFVRNTTNVTVSNVNVTVENQRIGQGVGVFSIRDNASYVTVENSNFKTTNNSGSSTLVLAGASYCNINNNTITGTGNVGNLLYLTTYNVAGVAEDDIELNSYNNITNNVLNGPSTTSLICYGITLTGHDNLIANNNVNVAGQGITTQWGYTDPAAPQNGNNSDRYKGNYYINNTVNRGASFKATNNSTVENNTCSGTVISGVNSTLKNNAFTGVVSLQSGSNATENTITTLKALGNNTIIGNNITLLNITGSNVAMINNTGDSLYVISGLTNITSCNDNFQERETLSNITLCNHTHDTNIRKSKSLKREDIEWYEITITKDNYLTYLRESGTLPFSTVKNHPYIRIYIEDLPTSQFGMGIAGKACKGYVYEIIGKNFTKNNFQLNIGNSIDSNITIANMTLTYDESYADPANMIVLKTMYSNVLLENITINATFEDSVDSNICPIKSTFYDGNNITINNCNITLKSTEFNNPVEYTISAIDLEKNNNTVSNCNINANVPSSYINWGTNNFPVSVVIYSRTTNTTLKNNNITITESQALNPDQHYNTLYGIYVTKNNTIVNNTINITGTEYLYSIQVRGSNNNISNNNINLTSRNYLSGIMMEGAGMSNNTIANNNIIFNGGNRSSDPGTKAEDSVYGISIQNFGYGGYDYTPGTGNVTNNKIINNTITGTGYNVYAFEQFGGDNTTVANNTINLTAHTPMAIGIIGAYSNVTGNNIIVDGADNATYSSADYLKPRTTGIYFAYGQENNAINNTINSQNNAGIIIDDETNDIVRYNTVKSLNNTYAVTVTGNNSQITDNKLSAKELSGDNSVLATGENNTIKDNTGNIGTGVLTITLNPTEAHVNDTVVVNVKFVDEDGNAISSKPIHIKVDEFGIDTTVNTNENGIATTDFVVTKLSDTVFVEASYDGTDYAVEGQTAILDITKYETELTVNDQLNVFTPNSNCTINGTLTDKTNPIANAEIIISIANMDGVIVTTDNDGKYSYTFNVGATEGTYNVEVTYNGNDKYEDAVATASYDVEKYGTILKIDPIDNTTPKANMIITGSLVEFYTSEGVANAEITITLNNNTYTNMTDAKGIFKFNIVAPANTGKYTVDASYAGNDTHDMDTDSAEFNVEKIDSIITIDAIGSVDANSNVNVTGILVDSAQNAIINQEVTITVNNKKYTTTTGSDGKYVVTIMSPVVTGHYDVSASYAGSDVYTMASAQTSMFVKEETGITAEGPISATVNSTITINGTLMDASDNGIANATITVVFEGKDYTTTTNGDGKFTCDIMTTTVGDNIPVTVRYDGNDTYMASSEIISVDVEKLGSELTLNPVNNTSINSTVDVSGVLSEEYTQKAIANSTVTIIVDGISYNTVTDDNGNFKVTIKAAATTGTYTIKASYDGSDLYTPSSDETTFDVEKISTKTTVDAVNGVIYEKVNLTAHITDVNGNNVTGGKVVFSINGVEVTDNNGNVIYANVTGGVATITKEAPRVWHKENTTIVATYLGNDAYDDSVSEKADVIITLRTANIDVLTNGTKVKVGDTTSIIAHVYYNNTLVNEGKVIFKLNGKTLKDDDGNIIFVKVENGVAKLDYTITSIYSAKEYTLTAVFSGKDYNRVATESHLTVLRTNTHIQAEMVNITSNNATVSLKIFDEKNNLINRDTKVTVKVNGKTVYNQIIVSNGVANLNLNLPVSSKPYNITIISGENSVYATSTTSFMFKNTVKIPTKVTATAKLVNNKTATVSVKINDNNNKPVTGNTKVVVKLNGKTQANAIAVNGVADIDMIPPTIKGTYTLVVMTGETSIYEKATTTTTLKI